MTKPAASEPQHSVDTAADAVRGAAGKASDVLREGAGKAGESLSTATGMVADAAGETLRAVRDNVSEGVQQAGKTADKLASAAVGTVKRYPIRSVLVIAAAVAVAGFVAGVITSKRL